MSDIQLRFGKDMLVLSGSIDATLAQEGLAIEFDRQYLNLFESESVLDALKLQMVAGAQCLVTSTQDITQARLAHARMDGDADRLAQAALDIANELRPQHILVEIGPCGLPLDSSSKDSLNENRKQYADAARAFASYEFDAFLLSGFTSIDDLKCALMGMKQVSDAPVFASVTIGPADGFGSASAAPCDDKADSFSADDIESGLAFGGYTVLDDPMSKMSYLDRHAPLAPDQLPQAIEAMLDLGAAVVGFETAEPMNKVLDYLEIATHATNLPLLVQLRIINDPMGASSLGLVPLEDLKEYTPDTLVYAGMRLRDAGVQFLRATGDALPACTGALVAASAGEDVRPR